MRGRGHTAGVGRSGLGAPLPHLRNKNGPHLCGAWAVEEVPWCAPQTWVCTPVVRHARQATAELAQVLLALNLLTSGHRIGRLPHHTLR